MPHVKSHFVPSHVAWVAPAGTGHAAHAVPHEFTSVFDEHRLPQACVPTGHAPSQGAAVSTQALLQSFLPEGQLPSQSLFTQVAVPPSGSGQREHEPPHVFASSSLTHAPAQRCSPAVHVGTESSETSGVPVKPSSIGLSASGSSASGCVTGASTGLSSAASSLRSVEPSFLSTKAFPPPQADSKTATTKEAESEAMDFGTTGGTL